MFRSRRLLTAIVIVTGVATIVAIVGLRAPSSPPSRPDSYLFCFWNVENLFDDQVDTRPYSDPELDPWFANNATIREQKYNNLSKALIALNDGKGPDILAVAEVESMRAAELLRDALNARLSDSSLHYNHVLMREVTAKRHIATAILTRLPVNADKTQLLSPDLRILEGHIEVDNHELVVLASHWKARDGMNVNVTKVARANYGSKIYSRFKELYKRNPDVNIVVCGDFNDTPLDESVVGFLHATDDMEKVRRVGDEPSLLNLMAGKSPNDFGTYRRSNGQWSIFNQIVVSPGLLNNHGWSCDPESVQVVNTLTKPGDPDRAPWRFGYPSGPADRGYSDHFPVTVRLKVTGK